MIPFEKIDQLLAELGKNRAWLAEKAGRSPGSIRSALAPNAQAKHRSEHLQRALSAAIEKEQIEQATQQPTQKNLPDCITIYATQTEFDCWSKAATHEQKPIKDWAINALNEAAEEWRSERQLRIADHPSEYKSNGNGTNGQGKP